MNARGDFDAAYFLDAFGCDEAANQTRRTHEGSGVLVRGWAVLTDPSRPADAALTTIDGIEPRELEYGEVRRDAAARAGLGGAPAVGFWGVRPLRGLPAGAHVLRVELLDRATGSRAALETAIEFEIEDGSAPFAVAQPLTGAELQIVVDEFAVAGPSDRRDPAVETVSRGSTLGLRGWAVDRRLRTAASDVYACVDGAIVARGIVGTVHADVGERLGISDARCGFVVHVATDALTEGTHRLEVRALAADGAGFAASDAFSFYVR